MALVKGGLWGTILLIIRERRIKRARWKGQHDAEARLRAGDGLDKTDTSMASSRRPSVHGAATRREAMPPCQRKHRPALLPPAPPVSQAAEGTRQGGTAHWQPSSPADHTVAGARCLVALAAREGQVGPAPATAPARQALLLRHGSRTSATRPTWRALPATRQTWTRLRASSRTLNKSTVTKAAELCSKISAPCSNARAPKMQR